MMFYVMIGVNIGNRRITNFDLSGRNRFGQSEANGNFGFWKQVQPLMRNDTANII